MLTLAPPVLLIVKAWVAVPSWMLPVPFTEAVLSPRMKPAVFGPVRMSVLVPPLSGPCKVMAAVPLSVKVRLAFQAKPPKVTAETKVEARRRRSRCTCPKNAMAAVKPVAWLEVDVAARG